MNWWREFIDSWKAFSFARPIPERKPMTWQASSSADQAMAIEARYSCRPNDYEARMAAMEDDVEMWREMSHAFEFDVGRLQADKKNMQIVIDYWTKRAIEAETRGGK